MKTVYKRKFYLGFVSDMKNLEPLYSEMAEKGWLIDKIGLLSHRFRAIEPCKKRFFADFLPQITVFDYPENEEAKDYRQICEESGWTFAAAHRQLHIFYTDSENPEPLPIHTDNSVIANICLKASRKYEWFLFAFALLAFWPLIIGVNLLLSNAALLILLGNLILLLGLSWPYGYLVYWYIRTQKAARNNLPLPPVNRRLAILRMKLLIAGLIGSMLCTIIGAFSIMFVGIPLIVIALILFMGVAVAGVFFWLWRQIGKKERSRAGNIKFVAVTAAVFVVFMIVLNAGIDYYVAKIVQPMLYNPETFDRSNALTLTDVGVDTAPEDTFGRAAGSFAVPIEYLYLEVGAGGSVSTRIYRAANKTVAGWLYENFVNEMTAKPNKRARLADATFTALSVGESADWGAVKGVMLRSADGSAVQVLLLNDKTILDLYVVYEEGQVVDLELFNDAALELWGGLLTNKLASGYNNT